MGVRTTHQRTAVTMILAGAGSTTFGVFRVRILRGGWWNIHHARQIGSIVVPDGEQHPSYRAMAERFASADWPALEW